MKVVKEISAVTRLNLRSLPLRLGTSSVVVIGIAGVVGVLVSILAMMAGLSQMMSSTAPTAARRSSSGRPTAPTTWSCKGVIIVLMVIPNRPRAMIDATTASS